jgi:cytochrome c oxidase subunit 2
MQVELYEKGWMWASGAMLILFVGAIVGSAAMHSLHPPSHIETIDPVRVRTETEFSSPGVRVGEDGRVTAVVVAELYRFAPSVLRVPVDTPIRFRITSPDVLHGFQVVGTNANLVIVPGYVSEMITTFPEPGEYLIVCNEYCGTAHHSMYGRLIVETP